MMKLMCDCGCGHPIAEYDAGQMPVIIQRGSLLMELRVMPGASGARPNIRPFCARAAVTEGEIVFPISGRLVEDPGAVAPDRRVRSITTKLDTAAKADQAADGKDEERGVKPSAPAPMAGAGASSW